MKFPSVREVLLFFRVKISLIWGGGGGSTYGKNQVAALTASFNQSMNVDLGNAFALFFPENLKDGVKY